MEKRGEYRMCGFKKRDCMLLGGLLILCMFIASMFDFQISKAVFDSTNPLGIFLAAYGQLPATLAISLGGTLLIYTSQNRTSLQRVLSWIGGILLQAMSFGMAILDPILHLHDCPLVIIVIVAILLLVSANAGLLYYIKESEQEDIKRVMKLLLFVVFVQLIVINIIKIPWGRPRMRMIMETPQAMFQPWWVIGSQSKDLFMNLGVAAEEFKSFPSGHNACAACVMMITALPLLKKKPNKNASLLFWLGVGITLLVGGSRIIMGAHFLSDITIGFTVTFLIELLGYHIFFKQSNI